jgi:hypothetical protein
MKAIIALTLLIGVSAHAATFISYTASADPNVTPDANGNTVNAWSVATSGAGGGSFLGNSGSNGDGNGAGAGSSAWGLYSLASTGLANAVHTMAGGSLGVGQLLAMDFDNGYVGAGGVVGLSLWNAADQNLFEFFFTGGQTNYQKNDSGGFSATAKSFTDDGFKFQFALTSLTSYTASLGGTNLTGSLISQTDQAVAKVRVFSYNNPGATTNDLFFNNLAVTPEPSRALLLVLGLTGLIIRRRPR